MTDEAVVTVRGIAAGGDGVATLPDGRTVFVPRAAPGDRLRLREIRLHRRLARATIASIVEPGPDRVEPPCPHYGPDRCGGCQLMHLGAAAQRAVKGRVVGDALRRIARLTVDDPEVVPADAMLGYRAKVTFAVQDGVIGLHRQGEPGRLVDVRRCLLLAPALDALHQRIRRSRGALPRDAVRLVLRLDAEGRAHAIVGTGGGAWSAPRGLVEAMEGAILWWQPEGGAARVVAGGDTPWPVTVFEQVHPAMGHLVRRRAVAAALQVAGEGDVVWDLYAGIGETTALLASHGCQVVSVELDPRAVELAERLGPVGPRRLVGDVGERIASLDPAPRVVVTNPPRAGMAEGVTRRIADLGPQRICYVSCDPATLARDIRRLTDAAGYRLEAVTAFDQFPQTAHVECLAILERP